MRSGTDSAGSHAAYKHKGHVGKSVCRVRERHALPRLRQRITMPLFDARRQQKRRTVRIDSHAGNSVLASTRGLGISPGNSLHQNQVFTSASGVMAFGQRQEVLLAAHRASARLKRVLTCGCPWSTLRSKNRNCAVRVSQFTNGPDLSWLAATVHRHVPCTRFGVTPFYLPLQLSGEFCGRAVAPRRRMVRQGGVHRTCKQPPLPCRGEFLLP